MFLAYYTPILIDSRYFKITFLIELYFRWIFTLERYKKCIKQGTKQKVTKKEGDLINDGCME